MIFEKIKQLKEQNLTIGIVFSAFDLLHAGHVAMLAEAKNHCDYLIAGLQTDPTIDRSLSKNRPVQTIVERQIQLASCRYVDEIVIYQTEKDLIDLLLTLPVDVRILGDEYRTIDFTGRQECEDLGIELFYNSRNHSFSTTDLRKRVAEAEKCKLSDAIFKNREEIITDMCYTWRHDYGMTKCEDDGVGSAGMTMSEQMLFRSRMSQLFDNSIITHMEFKQ